MLYIHSSHRATLRALALLGVWLAAALPSAAQAVYTQDFEGEVGAEWSYRVTERTPVGERGFLGQFGNDAVKLTLNDLPPHGVITVSFDLFIIRTWDGSGENGWGTDVWTLGVENGPVLLDTTFSYPGCPFPRQDFPGRYGSAHYTGGTGAAEMNTLGYTWTFSDGVPRPLDSVYRLSFAFPHSGDSLTLNFGASGLQELFDESWGLDNVRVVVGTVPPGRLVVSPRRLQFGSARGAGKTRSFRIRNIGAAPVSGNVSELFAPLQVVSGGGRFTLQPRESRTVTVRLGPGGRGSFSDTLAVTSTDPLHPVVPVKIQGTRK